MVARQQFSSARLAWGIVVALVLLYALFFSLYTMQRHNAFLTSAFDLGNFDQAIWNTAQGRPLAMSNIPGVTMRFAHHVEPILFLIAPFYWLWPDVRLLLILQSVAIGLSAIPLYLYSQRRVGRWAAVLLVATYLMFPSLQGVNLFDFHAVALAPLFLLLAWNWLDERRDIPFLIAGILAAGTKEEISLLVAMMGLYALVVQRRRFGLIPFVGGVGWFLLVLQVITPAFNTSGQHEFIGYYRQWGDGPLDLALNLLTKPLVPLFWLFSPPRSDYLWDLLTPTLGLSLFAAPVLLIAAPSLAVNLFSSYPPMVALEGYHYPAPIIPFVLASAAAGVAGVTRILSPQINRQHLFATLAAGGMLVSTLIYHQQHGYTPLAAGWQWPTVTAHDRIGTELLATIPPEGAVSAQSPINPHLSQRQQIYRYPDGQADADYLVFDVTAPDLFVHPNDLRDDIQGKVANGEWCMANGTDGWLVLQRNQEASPCKTTLPDDFYSYARVEQVQPQFAADITYGDAVRLVGYDVVAQGAETQVRFYWQALRPITEPYRLWPLFFNAAGDRVLEDTSTRPLIETVWYPPQQWRVGETVMTTTLPWAVGADYTLVMAVLADGDAPEGARLPVTVGAGAALPEMSKADAPTLLRVRDNQVITAALRRFTMPDSTTPLNATVGETIALRGAEGLANLHAGTSLPLTLYWQAITAPAGDYTVFVQLVGANGVVAQSDQQPTVQIGDDRVIHPTPQWATNEIVADTHLLNLPPDLPGDTYQVIVGMYDLSRNAARLPVMQNGGALADNAIVLTTFSVD